MSTLLSALYGYSKDFDTGIAEVSQTLDADITYSYGTSSILIVFTCILHALALIAAVTGYVITDAPHMNMPQVQYSKMGNDFAGLDQEGSFLCVGGSEGGEESA